MCLINIEKKIMGDKTFVSSCDFLMKRLTRSIKLYLTRNRSMWLIHGISRLTLTSTNSIHPILPAVKTNLIQQCLLTVRLTSLCSVPINLVSIVSCLLIVMTIYVQFWSLAGRHTLRGPVMIGFQRRCSDLYEQSCTAIIVVPTWLMTVA